MGPDIILPIIMFCTLAWLVNNWIRAKYGYALDDGAGGKIERKDDGETLRLRDENRQLRDQIENVCDRMAVLERIVTDKGYGLAEEIERLRSREDNAR